MAKEVMLRFIEKTNIPPKKRSSIKDRILKQVKEQYGHMDNVYVKGIIKLIKSVK